jgi:hypothetical protein
MPQSMPQWEIDLRDTVRQFMETANTNATGEGAQAGSRTYDMRNLDGMSTAELLKFVKENGVSTTSRMGEVALGDDDPLVQQFIEQFGTRDWGDVEAPDSDNRRARGYVIGYGEPTYGQEGANGISILADGTRVLTLPDGSYVREEANINSDEVAGQHRHDETMNRESRQRLAAVLAGPVVVGGLQAAGALGGAGAAGGAAQGAGGLALTAEGAAGVGAGASGSAGFSGLGASAAAGGAGAAGSAGGGASTAGASGATSAATPAATTGGSSTGFIGRAVDGVTGWYNGLSPAGRLILGTAVSQGAGALIQGNAQREQQEFIEQQNEEREQDRIRRSRIPNFSGAFKPKPPGILGSRRGG